MPQQFENLSRGQKQRYTRIEERNKTGESVSGKSNGNWKGDAVGIQGTHIRMKNLVEKPERCTICNKIKKLDLCNVDHRYSLDVEDYFYACRSCHRQHDHDKGIVGIGSFVMLRKNKDGAS